MYLMSEFQRGMLIGAAIYVLAAFACVVGWVYVLGRVLNYFKIKKNGRNTVLKGHDIYEHLTAFIMATVILLPFAIMLVNAASYRIIQYLGYK